MTAKDKASELVKQYWTEGITYRTSIKSAIIYVKGIIEEHKRYFSNEYSEERLKYWKEVLEHIKSI